jgi:hypothetical protein
MFSPYLTSALMLFHRTLKAWSTCACKGFALQKVKLSSVKKKEGLDEVYFFEVAQVGTLFKFLMSSA